MIDIENIKKKAEGIKKDFWTNDRLPYVDLKLQEFYDNNYRTWIDNAKELRYNYPVETNLFLANIYRSNFIFKLVSDRFSLLKKKPRYTIYDKIRIIKNAFENSYHHFGFITICANYSKDYIDSIYKNWFIPERAKEFTDESSLNPWRNKENDIISGKKWTILNCPLLNFSPVAIEIIQKIKNSESHERLVVTENELIILDNNKSSYHIELKNFNKLFKYLFYSLNLALHFNVMLAIKYNFWITPTLILLNADKFKYKQVSLPELQDKKKKKNKDKDKKKINQSSIESLEYLMALGYSLFEFIFLKVWDKIKADKANIDRFLDCYSLKFDSKKFEEFQKKAVVDIIQSIASLNNKVKVWYLSEEIDTSLTEITIEKLSDFDFDNFIQDFQRTISKVYSQGSKEVKKDFMGLFIIFGMVSFFSPLVRINESLNEIIIEK